MAEGRLPVLEYSAPLTEQKRKSAWGKASITLGLVAALCLVALIYSHMAEEAITCSFFVACLLGLACGLIGIFPRARRSGFAIAGLIVNGLLLVLLVA